MTQTLPPLPPLEACDRPGPGDEVIFRIAELYYAPARVVAIGEGDRLVLATNSAALPGPLTALRGPGVGQWLTYRDAATPPTAAAESVDHVARVATKYGLTRESPAEAVERYRAALAQRLRAAAEQLEVSAAVLEPEAATLIRWRISGIGDAMAIVDGEDPFKGSPE